jgi:hypothetical protein
MLLHFTWEMGTGFGISFVLVPLARSPPCMGITSTGEFR